MAKYKFIKPYSAKVTVGGVVGVSVKSFKVGDIVEGEVNDIQMVGDKTKNVKSAYVRVRVAPAPNPNVKMMPYTEFINVPMDVLSGNINKQGAPQNTGLKLFLFGEGSEGLGYVQPWVKYSIGIIIVYALYKTFIKSEAKA